MKFDDQEFRRKMERMRSARKAARHDALRSIGHDLSRWINFSRSYDTGRFLRGYQIAFQQIGHNTYLDDLQRSRYIGRAIQVLAEQYDFWTRQAQQARTTLAERYPDGSRRGRAAGYRALRQKLVKAQNLQTRAREELEKFRAAPYGIIMSPLRWAFDPLTSSGRHLVTVRPRPYGGRGSIVDRASSTQARILNLEPHTAFVEARDRVLSRAFGNLAASGLDAAAKYVKGISNVNRVQGAARERFLAGR